MIDPASMGDWTQAVVMASLLAGAGLALSRALRVEPEVERESRSALPWEVWRDQRTEGPLRFDMAASAERSRGRP